MMPNSTYSHPSVLELSFGLLTALKYLYGTIVLLLFLMIAVSSSTVITTIALHRTLHEPMYIFIAALCINGLYGSICFFPALFVNLVSQTQTISYIGCLIQIFGIHTYIGGEIGVLAAMAFDRYLCICNPLRYNSLMTFSTMFKLIGAAWLYIIILISIHVILTIRLPLCSSVIQKIYCDNWSVVTLSCIDTTLNNIFGLLITSVTVLLAGCIGISYMKILIVCMKSSKNVRAKALQTCTPHLISLNYFGADILCEILLLRFPVNAMPYQLKIIISVQAFVFAPLLNPLMYGLKMREIRVKIGKIFYPKTISQVERHGKVQEQ
ncbi:olfactory receptor 6N2 [Xenopus laevis]|uniref:Olfactory receptor 6N2 n=1 Tax=Xenopus laevis TaxID=8355 RepID=A0A8J1M6F8_XENLA|nr:olfactory receptor 6N2 [Xenopus laevis]